jgi:DNA-binding transcriptional regulator YdaS (Cro superfamily)
MSPDGVMMAMSLKLHLTSLSASEQEELAQSCRTTVGHLRNVAYGFRVASPALAMSLEDLTHGAVTRRDLRPKDCHLIWPELAEQGA